MIKYGNFPRNCALFERGSEWTGGAAEPAGSAFPGGAVGTRGKPAGSRFYIHGRSLARNCARMSKYRNCSRNLSGQSVVEMSKYGGRWEFSATMLVTREQVSHGRNTDETRKFCEQARPVFNLR